MTTDDHTETVEQVLEQSRYLALGTTDGEAPWIAPIEFFRDAEGNICFLSTTDSRHARHIEENGTVAVALWLDDQPEFAPDLTATLNGVQMRGRGYRVPEEEHSPTIEAVLGELDIAMPPYAAYVIEPERVYVPVVEDGVNKRVEVDLD